MSAIIYPPVDPPQVLETLCLELRSCCDAPTYIKWIDIGGGEVHWAFCKPEIQRLENLYGEKYMPYQFDVYEMPLREGVISNESNHNIRLFYEGKLNEVQIISNSFFSGNNWQIYYGLNGTSHIWTRVTPKAGAGQPFLTNKKGLYRFEIEISLPKNYNMIQ